MNPDSIYFPQSRKCPVCKTAFATQRVRSSASVVSERDSDFRTCYKTINPTHYSIHVCPNCLFAAQDSQFEQEIPDGEREAIYRALLQLKQQEPDFGGKRTSEQALRTLELAVRSAQLRKQGASALAGLFLRAAWICRELGNAERELVFLEQAKTFYLESFAGERETKMSQCTLMYLIGELHRRTGNYQEAVRWFSRVISDRGIKAEPEIERLTRQRWAEAKEAFGRAQSNPDAPPVLEKRRQSIRVTLEEDLLLWARRALGTNSPGVGLDDLLRALLSLVRERQADLGGCRSDEELLAKLRSVLTAPPESTNH